MNKGHHALRAMPTKNGFELHDDWMGAMNDQTNDLMRSARHYAKIAGESVSTHNDRTNMRRLASAVNRLCDALEQAQERIAGLNDQINALNRDYRKRWIELDRLRAALEEIADAKGDHKAYDYYLILQRARSIARRALGKE